MAFLRWFGLVLACVGISLAGNVSVKAVTYNIRYDAGNDRGTRDWDQRKGKVVNYLLESGATVIGLQEALKHQLDDVKGAMEGYGRIGVGRSDGKAGGEFSPILFKESVWKLDTEESGTFWLSETPEKAGSKSWGTSVTRICTWARLIHRESGVAIYVFNSHWDHRSAEARKGSAGLILKRIKQRKQADEPAILMGDLNATTDSPELKVLLNSGLLSDPGKEQFSTFNRWKAERLPGKRIDHVLVTAGWKDTKAMVQANGNPAASDHHPVVFEGKLVSVQETDK